jgi:chlorite dismutase
MIDIRERGAPRDGEPQALDSRLWMQLLVLEAQGAEVPAGRLPWTPEAGDPLVIYADWTHPRRFGVLSWHEDPGWFTHRLHTLLDPLLLHVGDVPRYRIVPELTMAGRTYSTGYEPELHHWLLRRPVELATAAANEWALWYPLRRTGAFSRLPPQEQGAILREHGEIGRAYGEASLVGDIRLACHGLDPHDNEFVLGLVGPRLHPLSHLVQAMRKTRQTSEFIEQMGPFFVGRTIWRGGR